MNFKKRSILIIFIIVIISIIFGVFYCFNYNNRKDDTQANMEFVINDTLSEGNNQKVKVFLLAGQSNASGVASNMELRNNISEENFNEYQEGYSNVYINYYNDNGNNKSLGFTNVKLGQGFATDYFGPELGMGEKLSELYENETIFIIKYAWGATNLHTQWNCRYGNIYKVFIKFVNESMNYLKNKNYDAEIVAMMWMQGESDSFDRTGYNYYDNLIDMIASMRKELKEYTSDRGMYFIDAYISSSTLWPFHKVVNEDKSKVCSKSDLNICIDTNSEGLSTDKEPVNSPDLAHYDSLSELKLGHLFVDAYESNS